jgi:hypothetical protein
MTPRQSPFSSALTPPVAPGTPPRTRYAPDQEAIAAADRISDTDVLAVIDARGGQTYAASVDTGLANRFPFVDAGERKRAVQRALASGTVVHTPMGVFRRPPRGDD